ncbi:MAG: hypothetical protein ACE5HI_10955 [bacterium]
MKTVKVKKTLLLVGIIIASASQFGCKYTITGEQPTLLIYYEDGPIMSKWRHITDEDDLKDLSIQRLSNLNLELLNMPYEVESLVIHSQRFFKRKYAGFSAVTITVPEELSQCMQKKTAFRMHRALRIELVSKYLYQCRHPIYTDHRRG